MEKYKEAVKIPPQNINSIDRVQVAAFLATLEIFEKNSIDYKGFEKEKIGVISACTLGIDKAIELTKSLRYKRLSQTLKGFDKKLAARLFNLGNKKYENEIGTGALSNIIASRVSNFFDFQGESFNLDSDRNSFPLALAIAVEKLQTHNLLILLDVKEDFENVKFRIPKIGVNSMLVSDLEFAKDNNLPIKYEIKNIKYKL